MGSGDWIFVYDVHEDIISTIFSFLSHKDLYALMRTSYTLNKIASNEFIWSEQYSLSPLKYFFPIPDHMPKFFKYKVYYKECFLKYSKAMSVFNDDTIGPKMSLLELSRQNLVENTPLAQAKFIKQHFKLISKSKALKILKDPYLKEIQLCFIKEFNMKKQLISSIFEISDYVGLSYFNSTSNLKQNWFNEYVRQNEFQEKAHINKISTEMENFLNGIKQNEKN